MRTWRICLPWTSGNNATLQTSLQKKAPPKRGLVKEETPMIRRVQGD
jgi:hypothetical protein